MQYCHHGTTNDFSLIIANVNAGAGSADSA
jgi:hypothetical protein